MSPNPMDAKLEGLRVVLLESDANQAKRIIRLFGQSRYLLSQVVVTRSVAETTFAIRATHTDLLILALDLPGGHGLDILNRIREAHADVPIIVLVQLETQHTGVAAVGAGAQDYLLKPVLNEELLAHTIETVMEHHRLVRQHRADVLRIARAQRAENVGRMTMGLVHDFKNLLMVIQNYATAVQKRHARDLRTSENVAAIAAAVQRGTKLCHQCLTLYRGSASAVAMFDLNVMVADMLPLLARLVPPTTGVMHLCSTDPVRAYGDIERLEQVIINLVINANDSLAEGGKVVIETRNIVRESADSEPDVSLPKRAFAGLFVTDDGCGMDIATRSKIFDEFFSTKTSGTGLGLAIVRDTVCGAGGAIAVDSELGQGSRFRVYLPAGVEGVAR